MTEDQKNYKCGYAPRALRRLPRPEGFDKVLFVGAKDGSVTVLRQEKGDVEFGSTYLALPATGGGRRSSVRSLLEWGQDRLLVGRDDGTLDVVRWRDALEAGAGFQIAETDTYSPPQAILGSGGESVRYATWIDEAQDRLLISYRYAGTRLFSGDIVEALRRPDLSHPLGAHEVLGGIRLAARIAGASSSFVLIGRKGKLWRWFPGSPSQIAAPIPLGPWDSSLSGKRDLPPATFDDATYVGHEINPGLKKIQALIVTTDTGVFALDLREESWESGYPRPVRLALPGGRLFSMAVTYAQIGPKGAAHLWLTNREGESFLFQNAPLGDQPLQAWALGFESSRLVHTDAQALTATSWPDRDKIWLARACRDDQIRVHSYAAEPRPLEQCGPAELLSARCDKDQVETALQRIRVSLELEDAGWPGYAMLAEYFEFQADGTTQGLFEFLSQPLTDLAAAILANESETAPRENAPRTIQSAVRLWTYALIGIAHRQQKPREEFYLGILRFLRGLAEVKLPDPNLQRSLEDSVDWAVRFARKWGLYGEVNEIRQDLVRPLAILRQESDRETPRPRIDLLTYSSLLFRRSYSEVFHDDRSTTPGDHAWATRTLHLDFCHTPSSRRYEIDLVAVSWRRTGIAMYVLDPERAAERGVFSPIDSKSLSEQTENDGDDQFAYSRDLLLLARPETPNGFFLLRARRANRTSPWDQDLECWSCTLEPGSDGWVLTTAGPSKLTELNLGTRGSMYRFLKVPTAGSNQLVVIALEGRYGRPEIAQVEVTSTGKLKMKETSRLLGESNRAGAAESRTAEAQRNRTWSLAPADEGIVAGSDNGEIWLIRFDSKADTKVGQLASAVTALEAGMVGKRLRIYAGARDGTVIAFQELGARSHEARTAKRGFATLWSTVEKSAISYIDRHRYSAGNEEFDLVLAVTRNGSCLAFDDREEMGAFAQGDGGTHPQQPPFPGIRWLRTAIARTCFAAVSIPNRLPQEGDAWRLLAMASGDGRLDLLSLHYPRYTEQRKKEFGRHFDDLWSVACEEFDGPDNLRVVEATYRSAPLIPLIIVRLILDPDSRRGQQNAERLERLDALDRWLMPKFLRPLLDVRTHWKGASEPASAATKPATNPKIEREKVIVALSTLLDAAWKRGDVDLFQEISGLVLKRMNFMIFGLDPQADAEEAKNLYFALFDTIEGALQKWLGAEGDKETRVRIIVGKNLVDGDTAHRLFSVLQNRNDPQDQRDPWREILRKRIDGIRQLVWKGDPIVSLESLRAANHSLVRICRRLADERAKDGAGLTAIRWDLFKDYFEQLVSGAVQALGPNLRLRDALTHEYARTFALCLSACPEGAVRMTGRLAEVRLIVDPFSEDDLAARIEGQMDLLHDSFRIVPHAWVKHLFGSSFLKPDLDDLDLKLPTEGTGWAYRSIGRLRQDLDEVERLYRFISSLERFAAELAGEFRDRIGDHDTWKELKEIADLNRGSEILGHSWSFWGKALEDEDRLKAMQTAPLRARIRPDVVHFTRDLGQWAKDCEADLVVRYREKRIFQPEYGLYKEVLDRLQRAAAGFPGGAAVQTNLVVGILGHHLLEDLDLHVLELREIARNLDPIAVDAEDQEQATAGGESGTDPDSIESAFANLLVRRAERARSLPKNLRTLAKVLNPEGSLGELGQALGSLRAFVESTCEIKSWNPPTWDESSRGISPRERELLTLVLDELHQNHRYHSGYTRDELKSKKPVALWDDSCLTLRFPVSAGKERWSKLKEVCSGRGESPCEPSKGGDVPSSGVGLYLSCLAASMIGWKVELSPEDPDRDGSEEGWFIVCIKPQLLPKPPQVEPDPGLPRLPVSSVPLGRLAHVVVIDDKVEVALFVWRELGQVTGFGSAEVDEEEAATIFGGNAKQTLEETGAPEMLKTPGEDVAVWWVIADRNSAKRLSAVLHEIPATDPVYFLVDVRGPIGDSKPADRHYRWEDMVAQIQESRKAAYPRHIQLISSYEHGVRRFKNGDDEDPFPIRDKSPDTFSDLRKEILGPIETRRPRDPKEATEEIHVLVTGAGFELKERPERQRLGTLKTWQLLERWATECFGKNGWEVAREADGSAKGYPVPKEWLDRSELVKAAAEANLDRYWSLLLEAERAAHPAGLDQAQHEYKLRKLFRQEFVRDDWGYLRQALAAAGLGWDAWLSTNYTKFADRAIERVRRLEGPERIDWRTIEVSEEAARLHLEILHRQQDSNHEPTLFKLHGDLGHVLTMAIAGEDKTFLSRLPSFAPLYLAAQACLEVRARHATQVTWHIVGHGLRDQLLLQVIERVFRSSQEKTQLGELPHLKHRFVVVDPARGAKNDPNEHPAHRIRKQLGDDLAVKARCAPAGLYLTRLRRMGLAAFGKVVDAFDLPTDWVD